MSGRTISLVIGSSKKSRLEAKGSENCRTWTSTSCRPASSRVSLKVSMVCRDEWVVSSALARVLSSCLREYSLRMSMSSW